MDIEANLQRKIIMSYQTQKKIAEKKKYLQTCNFKLMRSSPYNWEKEKVEGIIIQEHCKQ
jgi:hypothetical protein